MSLERTLRSTFGASFFFFGFSVFFVCLVAVGVDASTSTLASRCAGLLGGVSSAIDILEGKVGAEGMEKLVLRSRRWTTLTWFYTIHGLSRSEAPSSRGKTDITAPRRQGER